MYHQKSCRLLKQLQNSDNLDLKLQAKVERVIIENNKAIGVEYKNKSGEILKEYAHKEVILASGSFITPKILLLSGVHVYLP